MKQVWSIINSVPAATETLWSRDISIEQHNVHVVAVAGCKTERVRSVHAAQLITRAEQKLQLTSRGCIQPRPAQHLLSLTTFVLLDFACKLRTCEYCFHAPLWLLTGIRTCGNSVLHVSVSTHRLDKWKADADFQILAEAFLLHAEADGKHVKSRLMLLTCKRRPESPLDIAWCLFAPLFCHRLKLHCTTRGCCCCLSHRKHEHSGTCHKIERNAFQNDSE